MTITAILQYFKDYEDQIRHKQSRLNPKAGHDVSSDILKQPEELLEYLKEQKVKRLRDFIKGKEKQLEFNQPLNRILEKAILQNEPRILDDAISFSNEAVRSEIIKHAQELANDSFWVCYPVQENKETRRPLLTFEITIRHEALTIESIHVHREACMLVIAYLTDTSVREAEKIYEKDIQRLLGQIENMNPPDAIEAVIKNIDQMIFKSFPSDKLSSIKEFKEYAGWSQLATAFVTTEEISGFYSPPFRQEIELVQKKANGNWPPLLASYLIGGGKEKTYDKIKNENYFHLGSYTDEYPVNLKQWHIVGNLNNIRLLAVNGPPGTGKTTLLKEMIADTFVQKTQRLIDIWDKEWTLTKNGKTQSYISPLKGKNKDSIIVTSTNNKAVDNIGKELLAEIPYFERLASDNSEMKGLFCARLGNNKNVQAFKQNVLTALMNALQNEENEKYFNSNQAVEQFQIIAERLRELEASIYSYSRYTQLCKDKGLLNKDGTHHLKLEKAKAELERAQQAEQSIKKQLGDLYQDQASQTADQKSLQEDCSALEEKERALYKILEEYRIYRKQKWLAFLPKRKRLFQKYPTEAYIQDQIIEIKQKLSHKREALERCGQYLLNLSDEMDKCKKRLEQMTLDCYEAQKQWDEQYALNQLLNQWQEAKENLETQLKTDNISALDIYSLVNHKTVLKQRHSLFMQALRVHEHYIWKNRKQILHNLKLVIKDNRWFSPFFRNSQIVLEDLEESLRGVWETFFLCFPVATTTLHSFKASQFPMLENLIDLLLVDESGQILPHYLVSPLYRSSRAVIVGDIAQIDPVRTISVEMSDLKPDVPESLQDMIDISSNSAQHYADRHSDIYEIMAEERVGVILEEHRRCESSIAAFSNHYVYQDKLTIIKEDNNDKLFANNLVAIDVRGKQTSNNVNEKEAALCEKIVQEFINRFGDHVKNDIGIITPFRNQAEYLRNSIKGIDIGTVHTFQGQEKKYILFSAVVNQKLTHFVGERPNLLNVALTRGKEQVIYLGNLDTALSSGNFLAKVVRTIQKRGRVFSLFNTSWNSNDMKEAEKVFRLFTDAATVKDTPFGRYLAEKFPKKMITDPRTHFQTLLHALESAQNSIQIISPWINPWIDIKLFEKLKWALDHNKQVSIMFGYNKTNATLEEIEKIYKADVSFNRKNALKNKERYIRVLRFLKCRLENRLIYRPPLHTKLLLVDDQYMLIGSHNWLSNDGSHANRKDEVSVIVTDKMSIDYVKSHYGLEVNGGAQT
ncbi:hypothetical protein JOD45_002196 [Scopulibacillus daqui]|uniref:PLD phosphodiesterase domain-containing protein n=1 Tax=Scopulibacillus daqui TaxID=1469162 RepID=A0ABS2Q175_9BACL|nr:AAA domain-containing protein [Scopulibacillus daqui]MBM7645971.1 hypothetical protein [Scopulibacillus daqui]